MNYLISLTQSSPSGEGFFRLFGVLRLIRVNIEMLGAVLLAIMQKI